MYLMSVGLLPNVYLMTVSFLFPEIVYFKLNFAQNVTAMVASDTRILLSTVCGTLGRMMCGFLESTRVLLNY